MKWLSGENLAPSSLKDVCRKEICFLSPIIGSTTRKLLIKIPNAPSLRDKNDIRTIRRPNRKKIFRRIESKARGSCPHRIDDPNVASAGLRIPGSHSNPFFVRREEDIAVVIVRAS